MVNSHIVHNILALLVNGISSFFFLSPVLRKVSVGMLDEDQSFIAIIGLICHYEELKCAKLVVPVQGETESWAAAAENWKQT